MKKLGIIFLSIVFLGSVGCASAKRAGAKKAEPISRQEMEQIRIDRMLFFQDKHI